MPELPEVENVRRGIIDFLNLDSEPASLEKLFLRRVDLRYPVPKSVKAAEGKLLIDVKRRGKYLLFEFQDVALLSHLGMSGVWTDQASARHDHIVMAFRGGRSLIYNDPRRFGCFLNAGRGQAAKLLAGLGPEPWMTKIEQDEVIMKFRRSARPIKQVLMDAQVIVGVGNIYASEALFRAQIDPFKIAKEISVPRLERLLMHTVKTLEEAIGKGGTTLRDYKTVRGSAGGFQDFLGVYGRKDQNCKSCGKKILAEPLAQRMTYWCPNCQRR